MSLSISSQGKSAAQHGSPRRPTTVGHRGLRKVAASSARDVQPNGVRKEASKTGENPHRRHRHMTTHRTWTRTEPQDRSSRSRRKCAKFVRKPLKMHPRTRFKGLVEIIPDFQVQTASRPQDPCPPACRKLQEILQKASVDCRKHEGKCLPEQETRRKKCPGFQVGTARQT